MKDIFPRWCVGSFGLSMINDAFLLWNEQHTMLDKSWGNKNYILTGLFATLFAALGLWCVRYYFREPEAK